jgi:hypothetical protein
MPIQRPHNRRVSTHYPLAHLLCFSIMYDDLTPATMYRLVPFHPTLRPLQLCLESPQLCLEYRRVTHSCKMICC